MTEQQVILVNERDEAIGTMEKMEAHRKGMLHRAFSVFIFDGDGRMLLQQRAGSKYHGAFLWTNACCSHPFPGEAVEKAAGRRLAEELGFQTPVQEIFSFTYRAEVENGLVEHEFDHVFAGQYEGEIRPEPAEVADCAYESMDDIRKRLEAEPARFTSWFRIAFPRIEDWWKTAYEKANGRKANN
ncbi:MAG TPA: isopentenyl-diphosphate Delta-isomerase [Flavisolibacter sp.]|nr:isopentenyl-diphosphate Delta-isomerase [Flavisolibacter sp.]